MLCLLDDYVEMSPAVGEGDNEYVEMAAYDEGELKSYID